MRIEIASAGVGTADPRAVSSSKTQANPLRYLGSNLLVLDENAPPAGRSVG
jgi:hypothetical protein